MVWRRLEPKNREDGPYRMQGAGMVACGDEALCVFGGIGCREFGEGRSQARAKRRCKSNELHLFCISSGKLLSYMLRDCWEYIGQNGYNNKNELEVWFVCETA